MTNNDITNIQAVEDAFRRSADAVREFENALNRMGSAMSGFTSGLQAVLGPLGEIPPKAQAPISAMDTLFGSISRFNTLAGAGKTIKSITGKLTALGGPKVWAVAGVIGGVGIAVDGLVRIFRGGISPTSEFAQRINANAAAFENMLDTLADRRRIMEATITALRILLAIPTENRTAAQIQVIENMVSSLSREMPELGLSFNRATGELGCHEAAMAMWESQQMEMLDGVGAEWGMCGTQVLAITLSPLLARAKATQSSV